jgi:hypothetical protein
VLAFHISNRFVDLEPALARLALEERLEARMVSDEPQGTDEENSPLSASDWVVMYADKSWIGPSDLANRAKELEEPQAGRAWTDDFNSILTAVRLGGAGE